MPSARELEKRRKANDELQAKGAEARGLLTPDQFVQYIQKYCRDKKDEETVTIKELKTLLSRSMLPGGGMSYNNVRLAVKERIEDHAANNPTGAGETAATIWRTLHALYPLMSMEAVDKALTDLVEAGEITVSDDQLPTFLPVVEEAETKKDN